MAVEEKRRSSEETETVPSEDTAIEREEDAIEEEDPVSVLRARAEDRMFPGTTWCEGEESLDSLLCYSWCLHSDVLRQIEMY